jgi:hypothetical protein
MRTRTVLAVVAIAVAAAPAAGCGDLSEAELRRQVESFASLASEGRFVAQGVRQDRTRATFVRVHAGELADEADSGAEKLRDARPQFGIDKDVRRAIDLAGATSDALGEIVLAPGDEAEGAKAERELTDLTTRLRRLAESL